MSDLLKKATEQVKSAVSNAPDTVQSAVKTGVAATGYHDPSIHGNEGQVGKPETNLAVIYNGANNVKVDNIGYPKMQDPQGKPMNNGVVLKVLLGCICGSDLHAYRGRSTAIAGKLVFGHEITGEIVETGPAVEAFKVGDWVSVPFNLTCGRCQPCKLRNFHACENTNYEAPGIQCGIPGYPLSGGWQGGQAQYVFIPYADFQLLKIPDLIKQPQHINKLVDIAMLADIWPTGHHGCVEAEVKPGKSVYIAGAGPVGLCALISAKLLGASIVFVGDIRPDRLKAVEEFGGVPIDLSKMNTTQAQEFIKSKNFGIENVDCSVECVGFEASGHTSNSTTNEPMTALDTCVQFTRAAGSIGVIGVFLPADPKGPDADFKQGKQKFRFGDSWIKGLNIKNGQAPVQRYNHDLMYLILHNKISLQKVLNVKIIKIEDAPNAYKSFGEGVYAKFVIDPHNTLKTY